MSKEHIIFYAKDDLGEMKVYDDGQYRLLSFADGDEQSRISIAKPNVLQHEYSQSMMLSLLFRTPKRLTVLGVGGGCLITAMNSAVSAIQIVGVELRPQVVDIAKKYFNLPTSKRINIVEQDAKAYIADFTHKKVDLLFTDLYHAHGMDKGVLREQFIENCDKQLKSDGWLVINCWEEEYNYLDLVELLRTYFIDIRSVNTGAGNWVIFAGKFMNHKNSKELKQEAKKLGDTLGFPLTKWLNRLESV